MRGAILQTSPLSRPFAALTATLSPRGGERDLKCLVPRGRHARILLPADEDLISSLVVDHRRVRIDRRAGVEAEGQVRGEREVDAGEVDGDDGLMVRES